MEEQTKILIIDDNIDLGENLKDILENEGYRTMVAVDGKSALNLLSGHIFELALLDLKLPDIHGLELINKLNGKAPSTEYIIITAYGTMNNAVEAVTHKNIIAFETKPLHVERLVTFIHEVIRRKKAERALRREKDKAQVYLDIAGVMFIVLNARGQVTMTNRKGCDILGYKQEEILGKNWFELFLPGAKKKEAEAVFKMQITGEREMDEYYESPVVTKSGEERIIAWHNIVLNDDKGNITGTLSSGTDITRQKQSEGLLRKSEEKYRTLTSNIPGTVYRTGPDRSTEFVTDSEILCGYPADAFNSKAIDWFDLIHPDDKDRVLEEWSTLMEKPVSLVQEYRVVSKDGNIRWVNDYKTSYLKEDESFMVVDGVVYDVTKRKLAELQIKESLKEKETLLHEIHHRVKNNLATIIGLLNIHKSKVGPEFVSHLVDLENRIRTMSMIHERLYQSNRFDKIEFYQYVNDLVSHLIHAFGKPHAYLSYSIDIKDVYFNIETSIPCGLIINELVTNSLKYAFPARNSESPQPHSKPNIHISLAPLVDRKFADKSTKEAYRLKVSDNGKGLPADFDINSNNTMGLKLAQMMVYQLEGEMEIVTEKQGITIVIDFLEQ